MSFPSIDINFQNGAIGSVSVSPDGVLGLICNAEAVGTTFLLNTPYVVKGMKSVATLGIVDSIPNHKLYKFLQEFYNEAGEGTELWIMGVARTVKISEVFIPVNGVAPADKLTNTANGRLRGIITVFNPDNSYTHTIVNGLDSDVVPSITAAQTYSVNYTDTKKAPIFVLIEGYNFNGTITALPDLLLRSDNRVGVLIGDTEKRTGTTASKGAAMGLLAGRIAKNPVHVKIAKVIDGPVKSDNVYILDAPVEEFDTESIHDKGYMTFRQHVGRSGYFFVEDHLACDTGDDYHFLVRRRVIDKAYRLAYDVMLDFLQGDFDLNADGTLSPFDATTIEGNIIRRIASEMTDNGELSVDKSNDKDKGVVVKMDLTNNMASNSKLKLEYLRVRPKGYATYIEVPLGYVPVQ